MSEFDTSRISPTAHYTGYVWCRHGLSPAALSTVTGRAMFYALKGPIYAASLALGGMTLETMLLQRHRIIDHLLDEAIADGRIGQIVEVAAGLSGRGYRLAKRHREAGLIYLEGDLPGMVARKRKRLAQLSDRSPHHQVVELNALADQGPDSLAQVASEQLDSQRGTAIITEGLLNYFPEQDVQGMWRRFAQLLAGSPQGGMYLSDLHLDDHTLAPLPIRIFLKALGIFARGGVHFHYQSEGLMRQSLADAGFAGVRLHRPAEHRQKLDLPSGSGPDVIGIVQAWHPGGAGAV
ncbi:MAG: class I SAM-dependent methyltransferase [Deltaproteobacteria bacterium]|nr:MAG: class I SAM-dependent methyltransferase [Deltaproteobacteria bacterium]